MRAHKGLCKNADGHIIEVIVINVTTAKNIEELTEKGLVNSKYVEDITEEVRKSAIELLMIEKGEYSEVDQNTLDFIIKCVERKR